MLLSRFEVLDTHRRSFLRQVRKSDGTYALEGKALTSMTTRERHAIATTRPVNFLFSPANLLHNMTRPGLESSNTGPRPAGVSAESDWSRKFSSGFELYISAISIVFGELRDLLLGLSYIGPIRDRLRHYYEIAGELPISVGSRGQHMANIIRRRLPEFRRELNNWLKRFGFGAGIQVVDLSEELFSLYFTNRDRAAASNIAESDFGASQILPLVVQALTAEQGSLTVAEQPEIHLNPLLQSLLGDLFVEMANSDHRLIAETHSEHLLLRIRRLIAAGKIDNQKVALYFVIKEDGISSVTPIPIDNNGDISSERWPSGFFEDTLRESLALAAARSQSQEN